MDKKKILILIKNLDGGTGTFLSQILKLKNYDFRVCALEKPRFGKSDFKNCYFFERRRGHLISYGLNPFLYIKIIKEYFWLRRIVNREKPDLLISVDTHCNILACLAKTDSRNLKVVITTHNNISAVVERKVPKLLRPVLITGGKKLLNRADRAVCISQGVAADFKKFFSIKDKIEVIPYGLNLSEARKQASIPIPREDKSLFESEKPKVISIGRFEEQKDFETLIKAFGEVIKTKDSELILIGDGSKRLELLSLVRELGIRKKVHFLGWKQNVYPYIKKSDVLVLSSHYEGFGYVLLEAMACATPIISTDSPYGPAEVLERGKWGILVSVGKISEMRKAILTILNNKYEHKKYSILSARRSKYFSEEKMLSKYQKLVRNLL